MRKDSQSHHRLPQCEPGAPEPPRHTHDVREPKTLTTPKPSVYVDQGVTERKLTRPLRKAICCYSVAPTVRVAPYPTAPLVGYVPEEAWRTSLKKSLGKCRQLDSRHHQKTRKSSDVLCGEWRPKRWHICTEERPVTTEMMAAAAWDNEVASIQRPFRAEVGEATRGQPAWAFRAQVTAEDRLAGSLGMR